MRALRALAEIALIAFRASPWQTLLCLAESAGRVMSALNPVFYGLFASGAVAHDNSRLLTAVVGLAVTTALSQLLELVGTSARVKQNEAVGFAFALRVSSLMAGIETIDHQESPDLLDRLQMFRDYAGMVAESFNALLNLISTAAWSASMLIVALSADWRLIILVIAGTSQLLVAPLMVRWDAAAEQQGSAGSRLSNTLLDTVLRSNGAAEARVFQLKDALRSRIRSAVLASQSGWIKFGQRHAIADLANSLFYFGAAISVLSWMLSDALHGGVTIWALTVAITSIGSLRNVNGSIASAVKYVSASVRSALRYAWLLDYAKDVHKQFAGQTAAPRSLDRGIVLSNVTYNYAGVAEPALADVSLEFPAGSVVALVGENGAGKSTLVKLLLGLYRPTKGCIQVDGIDLRELDIDGWRESCTGAFQDYADFEFTAGQSIGLGHVESIGCDEAISGAVLRAGADDVIARLPAGLATQLGPRWPNGVGLSGGQWQRVAIARAMMRRTPLLLVLDEPTASLDAHAEALLFDRYAAASELARQRGAVTLLVTHRFSTVASADLVVVLSGGHVAETGTHDALLAAGGRYAELYSLQARGYRAVE